MKPHARALVRVLLALVVIAPAAAGCGNRATPGATPSESPAPVVTSPAPVPTPSATPTPAPTQAAPAPPTGWTVVSSRVAYPWRWPNADNPATVTHTYPVPPLAQLVSIGAANHPAEPGERPYNRMSFTFTTAFPSYHFQFVDQLVADGSGKLVPLPGNGVLRIVFTQAQAHTPEGTSSIVSKPPAYLGMNRMVAYAPAGDFEGYVTYGIGIAAPHPHTNPQFQVRAYEVAYVDAHGAHRYTVAVDVDAW
jgi:hypothetical protein